MVNCLLFVTRAGSNTYVTYVGKSPSEVLTAESAMVFVFVVVIVVVAAQHDWNHKKEKKP